MTLRFELQEPIGHRVEDGLEVGVARKPGAPLSRLSAKFTKLASP